VGGFDESMLRLQDTDYCWRIQLAGTELHFIPEAVVHVRMRDNPRAFYRQTRDWAEYNVLLYKKYLPHGMPKLTLKRGIDEWFDLFLKFPRIRRKQGRKAWLKKFHYRLGRLKGSIKHKVIGL
jgi:cellulose synthase/poly-beta-1,6-N-acetylglucosamine synthase-like glycosyltransferase